MTSAHSKQVHHNTVWVIRVNHGGLHIQKYGSLKYEEIHNLRSGNISCILFELANTLRIAIFLSHVTSVEREDINPFPQGNLQFFHYTEHTVYG
jgi:hypothetical protein